MDVSARPGAKAGRWGRIPAALTAALVACSGNGMSTPGSAGNAAGSGGVKSANGGATNSTGGSSGGASSAGAVGSGGATGSAGSAGRASASGSGGQAGGSASTPTEKVLAGLPVARQEHSVVAAAGEIYVIGGYTPKVTDSVQAYDPVKDSWRDVQAFPEPLNHGNAGVIGDRIYVAGYYINNTMSTSTTKTYLYDPKSDTWSAKAALPTGTERAAGCVAVDAGSMYVVGGAHEGKSVAYAARYDAAGDTWEALPPLPERREHCTAGMLGGILYIAGGRMDGITGIEPKTWAFDPSSKVWTEKASLDPPRGGLAGAVLNGRLYVFGGEGNAGRSSGVFPDIDAYDPATNTWQTLAPMFVPRHGYGAATLNGRIYLPGGATHQGAGATQDNSVFYLP
jgi:N-acetylneuraminic acid mutarotase